MAYKRLNQPSEDLQTQVNRLFDEIVTLENRLDEAESKIKRLEAALHNQKNPVKVSYVGTSNVFTHEFERLEGKVPPEKKPELQASKNRIKAAVDMFDKHFDVDGNPTSDMGKLLMKRYGWD